MLIFNTLKKSIGLKLTALLLLSSLVIGLTINAWEMRSFLTEQRQAVATQIEEFLNLASGGAASAA
ncbi:MAG: hypothetical protein ACI9LO_001606 [Planctomycetota bacterium]|jgi:hypothetical protein